MDELTELIAGMVAIDSVNPDLVSGGAGEGALAHFVAGWLTEQGLEVHLDEVRPGRPNVIARARGTGGGRTLLLNGHTDTVGVAGMVEPYAPRIEGGRLYGRGAADMKCGLAACMVAIAGAHSAALPGDVLFTGVMDEEYAGLGSLDVAQRYRADGAVVAESTGMELVVAHKGFVWWELTARGLAAHGSRADLGVDAIAHMGRVLVRLEELNIGLLGSSPHPLLGTGTLHTSLIRGGQELSSYPATCVLGMERRTVPGEDADNAEGEIRAVLETLAADDPQFDVSLHRLLDRSPMETPADAAIIPVVEEAARTVTGHRPQRVGMGGWTDAASLSDAGIPSVLFGPSGAGAHAREEWVDLASVRACATIYRRVIESFCG